MVGGLRRVRRPTAVQIVRVSPHETLAGKFSRLTGKSLAGAGKVTNDLKIVVCVKEKMVSARILLR